jgi:predicted enzyme related to lactoylglutathione lyase
LKNPFDDTDPIWLSYFAVQDPVSIANKAQALGGKILIAPSADLREGTIALIQDPDGVILALQKWPR